MLGSFYKRAFERHPWCTLAVTNGSLTLLADSLAQVYEHRSLSEATQTWDAHRSGRFLIFGTAVAPLLAEWNKFLEFRFPIRSAAGTMLWGGLFRRLFMDQILFAPFGLALFVGSMGIMEGRRTQKELSEKFNDVYVPALLANWKIWPILQTFNFSVMPLRYVFDATYAASAYLFQPHVV